MGLAVAGAMVFCLGIGDWDMYDVCIEGLMAFCWVGSCAVG